MRKRFIIFLKFAIPIVIIGWLLSNLEQSSLDNLVSQRKNGWLLTMAFGIAFAATCISFARWYLLVRTIRLPFHLRDAFRLSFMGFLLNFVSAGSVGGDLFKAIFIAREQPGRRTEAVATVVVDRVVGLYALLVVASSAIVLTGIPDSAPTISAICNAALVATAVGGVALLAVLMPDFTRGRLPEFLAGLPKIGPTLRQMISSLRRYRNNPGVMVVVFAISILVHCMLAVAIFLIAVSLFDTAPTLVEHFIIVPLSLIAAALPLTPSGLGTFEAAMELLYHHASLTGPGMAEGILVALAYRLVTIGIAAVGVVFCWMSRREVRDVLQDVEKV